MVAWACVRKGRTTTEPTMGQEKSPRLEAPELPERRDFIKISALLGAGLASGALGASATAGSRARLALDKARVRLGGPVRVTLEDAPEGLGAVSAHLMEVTAEGRWLGVARRLTLRRQVAGGPLEAWVAAPGRRGGAEEVWVVAAVVDPLVSGSDAPLVSARLEVVCTPQLPGL